MSAVEVNYQEFSKLFKLDVVLTPRLTQVEPFSDRLFVTRMDYNLRNRKLLGYRESRNYDEQTMRRVYPEQERFYLIEG